MSLKLLDYKDFGLKPPKPGETALREQKELDRINEGRRAAGMPEATLQEFREHKAKSGQGVTPAPTVSVLGPPDENGRVQAYNLTQDQLQGRALLPPELMFADIRINYQGDWKKANTESATIAMAKRAPELFREQVSRYIQSGRIKNSKQAEEFMDRLLPHIDKNVESSSYLIDDVGDYATKLDKELLVAQGKDLRDYNEHGEQHPYISPYANRHGQLTIHDPHSGAFPQHTQEFPSKKSGWEPSGWSNPMDIRTAKTALAQFGPDPDKGMAQTSMNQYLVDQMGDLPEQLDTMYDVAPVQPEPNPIPQQPLQTQDMGIQSSPPGMVTGQPQQPNPPQFNPTDVIYGNDGEPAPERPRKETEWGYYYE